MLQLPEPLAIFSSSPLALLFNVGASNHSLVPALGLSLRLRRFTTDLETKTGVVMVERHLHRLTSVNLLCRIGPGDKRRLPDPPIEPKALPAH